MYLTPECYCPLDTQVTLDSGERGQLSSQNMGILDLCLNILVITSKIHLQFLVPTSIRLVTSPGLYDPPPLTMHVSLPYEPMTFTLTYSCALNIPKEQLGSWSPRAHWNFPTNSVDLGSLRISGGNQ